METTKIDPFELHPDTPKPEVQLESMKITVGQLNSIVEEIVSRIQGKPVKLWGHTNGDVEYWLQRVVREAEKNVVSQGL